MKKLQVPRAQWPILCMYDVLSLLRRRHCLIGVCEMDPGDSGLISDDRKDKANRYEAT